MNPDAAIDAVGGGARSIFGEDLVSVIVYGSWAFEPDAPLGDLDCHLIVQSSAAMTAARREEVRSLAASIERGTGVELDLWCISSEDLTSAAPRDLLAPPNRDHSWALHRAHWIAGRVRVVHGPPIEELVTAPSPEEIADGLRAELAYCVDAAVGRPATPVAAYIVRNCARIIASVRLRDPVRSKSESVAWALRNLPDDHHATLVAAEAVALGNAIEAQRRLVDSNAHTFLAWARRELGWTPRLRITGIEGFPEVREGDDLARLIVERMDLQHTDILVIAQKIVSKAEGRVVRANSDDDKARIVEAETRRVVAQRGPVTICETAHGFVCANAGVDASNADPGTLILLPVDPDASAERVRAGIEARTGARVGIIVSDTFGRPWRLGQTDVALGVAGMAAVQDMRGDRDRVGRELEATVIAGADELAGAAELVMGKSEGVPVVRIRGSWTLGAPGSARDLLRDPAEDLFPTGIGGQPSSTRRRGGRPG